MSFINREWTPENADEMHKEDWLAIFFSVVSYIALMVGAAMSALLIPIGFVILIIGILSALIMYWIIDPKLRSISAEYEKNEKDYLLQLEEIQKWKRINDTSVCCSNWNDDCLRSIFCWYDICIHLL